MTSGDNKAIVRRYFEQVWNKGDLEVVDEVISPTYNGYSGGMSGPDAVKLYISSYRTAFPGTHFTVLSMVEVADKVAVCWASRGTHRSEPPCNRPVTGMSIYRMAKGQIAAGCVEQDNGESIQHSGAVPWAN